MSLLLKMTSGAEAEISYQDNLIMLHSPDISAQWSPNRVGLQVTNHGTLVKVGFTTLSSKDPSVSNHYQSFHFAVEHYDRICEFFKAFGFPAHCFTDLSPLNKNAV